MHCTMNDKNNHAAPDLRPKSSDSDATPMETGPSIQLEHQLTDGGELLAKVLPAGGPLVSTHWTCPTCGLSVRGCHPRVCMDDCNPECPIGGAS